MSLVDGSQTAYGLQEKPHDRGRSPPGPEDNYTSWAAISSTPNRLFRKTIFQPLGGTAPRNFYTRYRMYKSC